MAQSQVRDRTVRVSLSVVFPRWSPFEKKIRTLLFTAALASLVLYAPLVASHSENICIVLIVYKPLIANVYIVPPVHMRTRRIAERGVRRVPASPREA